MINSQKTLKTLRAVLVDAFSSDSSSQLHVSNHDGDSPCVNGTLVSVFKETYKVGFRCLLQSQQRAGLEPTVRHESMCDVFDQSLERELSHKKISALLILPDLSEGNCTRTIPSGLLDSTVLSATSRLALTCCLLCSLCVDYLLSWFFNSSGAFPCCGFSSCHDYKLVHCCLYSDFTANVGGQLFFAVL